MLVRGMLIFSREFLLSGCHIYETFFKIKPYAYVVYSVSKSRTVSMTQIPLPPTTAKNSTERNYSA